MFTVDTENELQILCGKLKMVIKVRKSLDKTLVNCIDASGIIEHFKKIVSTIYIDKLSAESRYMIFRSAIKMFMNRIMESLNEDLESLPIEEVNDFRNALQSLLVQSIAKVKSFDYVSYQHDHSLSEV